MSATLPGTPSGYCRKCGSFYGGAKKAHEFVCPGSAGKPPPTYAERDN